MAVGNIRFLLHTPDPFPVHFHWQIADNVLWKGRTADAWALRMGLGTEDEDAEGGGGAIMKPGGGRDARVAAALLAFVEEGRASADWEQV